MRKTGREGRREKLLLIKDEGGYEGSRAARQNTEIPIYLGLCIFICLIWSLRDEAIECWK